MGWLVNIFGNGKNNLLPDEAAIKLTKLINGSFMQNLLWVGEIKEFIPYSEQQRENLIQEIHILRLACVEAVNNHHHNKSIKLEGLVEEKFEEMITAFSEHDKDMDVSYILDNYYEHVQEYLDAYDNSADQGFNRIVGELTTTYYANAGIDIMKANQEMDGFAKHYSEMRDIIGRQAASLMKETEEIIYRATLKENA